MEYKISEKIKQMILSESKGTIYTTNDFSDLGNQNTIKSVLLRLNNKNIIHRLIDGYYTVPHYIEIVGEYSYPSPTTMAYKIAEKHSWTICPSGSTALNQIGLSTQIPNVYEFISDGPYREYEYRGRNIRFRHTTNRTISNFSRPLALVIQSIKALGKDHITKKEINILARYCKDNVREDLIKGTKNIPVWIHDILKKINEVDE